MAKLDSFYYLDDKQIRMYLHQLPESIQNHLKVKFTMGFSFTGPKLDMTIEEEKKALNLYQQLVTVEEYLKVNKSVGNERPRSMNARAKNPFTFIHEVTKATKLLFPKDKVEKLNGLKHIAVWISEPNPSHLSVEDIDWDYSGTFLYLLETVGDAGEYQSVVSGVSALLALCNIVHGYDFFDKLLNRGSEETFGRWNYVHPIDKLKSLGAIQIDERKIETLYRCRYITDEQSYKINGKNYRVSDLLGYPIYIKEA